MSKPVTREPLPPDHPWFALDRRMRELEKERMILRTAPDQWVDLTPAEAQAAHPAILFCLQGMEEQ